jgi:hypothetical protein
MKEMFWRHEKEDAVKKGEGEKREKEKKRQKKDQCEQVSRMFSRRIEVASDWLTVIYYI